MMKRVGIISAMSIEMKLLQENMILEKELKICDFPFYVGAINNVPVILTTCSIGKVNAACCTQLLISNFNVDYIINTGIAGGIFNQLKLKDIVISSDVTYFDVRKIQMQTCYPHQETFQASEELISLSKKACEATLPDTQNYYVGRIATGDNFISSQSAKEKIMDEFSPYCVEMEGAAIGHVAYLNQVPFVVIRSISDFADDAAESTYEEFEAITSQQSAKITLKILELHSN